MDAGMTAEGAFYGFLSGFGIPAYAKTSVPDRAEFPYITYDLVVSGWNEGEVRVPVNVWYRTDSEAEPNAKVREIAAAIGRSGCTVRCDDGMLWIKKGAPWSQSLMSDYESISKDDKVKRRYLNIVVEYLTLD